ncbi:glycosyltransferase family 2 protein [Verrucomicrobiota bacterium]
MKTLSVIIPTLNEEAYIATTLQLATLPHVECIVVDGGSSDQTVDIAKNLGARVVHAPLGRARQMNAGAAETKTKTLLFLHADTLPPTNFPKIIDATLNQPKTAGGAFAFKLSETNLRLQMIEFFTNLRAELFQLPHGNQGLFIRKHLFDEMCVFREHRSWRTISLCAACADSATSASR